MNELQKKVLLFLLKEYGRELSEMSWYQDEVFLPDLTDEDRRWLSTMLTGKGWHGEEDGNFSLSDLLDLAEYWLTGMS